MFIISIVIAAFVIYSLSVFCFIKFFKGWRGVPSSMKVISLIPYANTVIVITIGVWLLLMVANIFWYEKIVKKK